MSNGFEGIRANVVRLEERLNCDEVKLEALAFSAAVVTADVESLRASISRAISEVTRKISKDIERYRTHSTEFCSIGRTTER
jgi:hypothetical protein